MTPDLGLQYATVLPVPDPPPEFGVSQMTYGLCAAVGYFILILSLAALVAVSRKKQPIAASAVAEEKAVGGKLEHQHPLRLFPRLLLDLVFFAILFLVFEFLFVASYNVLWSAVGRDHYSYAVRLSFGDVLSMAALFMFVGAPVAFLIALSRSCLADRLAGRAFSVIPTTDRLPVFIRWSMVFAVAAVLLLAGVILLLSPWVLSLNQPGL